MNDNNRTPMGPPASDRHWKWWIIALGLVYVLSPLDAAIPVFDDAVVMAITTWLARPRNN